MKKKMEKEDMDKDEQYGMEKFMHEEIECPIVRADGKLKKVPIETLAGITPASKRFQGAGKTWKPKGR